MYFIKTPYCRFFPSRLNLDVSIALFGYVLFSSLSLLASPAVYVSTAYLALTLVSFWIVLQFITNLDTKSYETGFKVYALLTTGLLVWFAVYDYVPGERLGNNTKILNPNSIALVAASAALTAMAFRRIVLRVCILGSAIVILILTGSRASTLSAVLGLTIIGIVRMRGTTLGRKIFFIGAVAAICLAGAYFSDEVVDACCVTHAGEVRFGPRSA